jgi:hypothetical protein
MTIAKQVVGSEATLKIAAFMDEVLYARGAEKHFVSFIRELSFRHGVTAYSRNIDWIVWRGVGLLHSESYGNALSIIRAINASDADIVFVMHFRSVWILPFLTKPHVFYLLEPPRAFYEQWLWDRLTMKKKVLVWLQGQIDRFIVRRYMQHGIANSAFSAEAGLRAYGRPFGVVYPGVDRREFYPEEEE